MGSNSGVKEGRKEGLWSMDVMEWDVYLCTITRWNTTSETALYKNGKEISGHLIAFVRR
jgi:hypothetical protein